MSAATSTALVTSYYAAFNRRDWPAMLGHLTSDVVHDVNQGDREVGLAAFTAFLARMDHAYRETVVELVVMPSADGRRAAAEFVIEGTYLVADAGMPPARGQAYRLPVGAFFEIVDGKVARVTNYYNLADWLRQVG